MTTLTSRNGTLEIGSKQPTVLINDKFVVDPTEVSALEDLRAGRLEPWRALARWGREMGTDMVDILINHPDLDEVALLPAAAVAIHDEIGCPVSLDSRNPAALDAALSALRPYKALINSVSAEPDCLESILPLARKHGAAVVGMPIGPRSGVPRTSAGRLAEARTIVEAATRHGIPPEDIVIDALVLASAVEPGSMAVTLETLQALHRELGVATILGIGNAGFGMPEPTRIDLAYLLAALPWGLDAALVDPATPGMVASVRAMDFLTGRDPYGLRYLEHYRRASRTARGGDVP